MKIQSTILLFLAAVGLVLAGFSPALAADVPRMSVEELKAILGHDKVTVLDVRAGRDWISAEFKIKGAERAAPEDFTSWANTYPKDNTLVLYCA